MSNIFGSGINCSRHGMFLLVALLMAGSGLLAPLCRAQGVERPVVELDADVRSLWPG